MVTKEQKAEILIHIFPYPFLIIFLETVTYPRKKDSTHSCNERKYGSDY